MPVSDLPFHQQIHTLLLSLRTQEPRRVSTNPHLNLGHNTKWNYSIGVAMQHCAGVGKLLLHLTG
jgi:hypothetical protein